MKRLTILNGAAATLCIWALAGCGRSTDLTSSTAALLAGNGGTASDAALDAMHSDLQSADSLMHGPCASFGFPLHIPDGCAYDAGSGSFACNLDIGGDGLTRTRSYQFLDASGNSQAAYDSSRTASIRFVSTIGGTTTRHGRTLTIEDHRELVESGLAGNETTRIWNGTGTSSHRDSPGVSDPSVQSSTTVDNVVVPAPWARDSWPLSGTITTQRISSDGTDQTGVITFNGTRYATLTAGGITTSIDLARGRFAGGGHGPGGPGGPGGRGRGRGRH